MSTSQTPTYSSIAQRLYELSEEEAMLPCSFVASKDTYFSSFDLRSVGMTSYDQGRIAWQIVFSLDEDVEGEFIVDIFGQTAGMDACLSRIFFSDFVQDQVKRMEVDCRSFEIAGFWLPNQSRAYKEWMAGREIIRARIWSHASRRTSQGEKSGLSFLGEWAIGRYNGAAELSEYSLHRLGVAGDAFALEEDPSGFSTAYVMGMFFEAKLYDLELASDPSRLLAQEADPLSIRRISFLSCFSLKTAVKCFGPAGLFLRHRVLPQITDECHDAIDEELLAAFPIRL